MGIDINEVAERFRRLGSPYCAEYILKYGLDSQISGGFDPDSTWRESIYKEALEKGVRWEDIYTPKEIPKDWIL